MPLPIMLAHKLVKGLSCLRRDGTLPYLRPDGKSQVTVEYDGAKPVRVDAVVVSSQHSPDVSQEQMRTDVIAKIVTPVIPAAMMDQDTKVYVNPTGRFVVGGPHGDAGVTGGRDVGWPGQLRLVGLDLDFVYLAVHGDLEFQGRLLLQRTGRRRRSRNLVSTSCQLALGPPASWQLAVTTNGNFSFCRS